MSLLGRMRRWLDGRDEVYGINRRNVDLVYAHNRRDDYRLADDKLIAKQLLESAGVAVPKTLAVCRGLFEVEPAIEMLSDKEDFVVKPADASGGLGILVAGRRIEPGRWRRVGGGTIDLEGLRFHLANIVFGAFSRGELQDQAFVEERVQAHSVVAALWDEGLSDIRVLTLRRKPMMAMLRVPTALSGGRANLHQGGLGLAIDLESGEVTRAVCSGELVTRHPDNGIALTGFAIPYWSEVLEVAERAAAAVPLGFLGVDIVLDETRGPLVLEINARPGIEIQNVHGSGLGIVMRRMGDPS